jgi:septum formation protein
MAGHKARNVAATKLPGIILAADTVVVAESDILGKPDSYDQALEMLTRLNGRTHNVHTGCMIMDQSDPDNSRTFTVSTQVAFANHSEAVLAAYARTGEPMGKAGGYAIQGSGGFLISEIQGSWSNVVGLPLSETAAALLSMRAIRI